jgi:transcriptional regulator GlxA family with amidase domain
LAPSITAAFGLNADVYDAGPPPIALFRQLSGALHNPAPYGENRAVSLAFQLLAKAAFARSKVGQQADGDIAGIVDHINANWNRPTLNIKNLADTMDINRSSLSRRFHKALGISPSEYIARLRVQNAMSMLSGTRKSVTDIASSCGYLDRRYFARLLRKRLGASPVRFRKKSLAGR